MTINPDKPINGSGVAVFGNLAGSFASALSTACARVVAGVGTGAGAATASGGGGAGAGEGAARDASGSAIDLAVLTGSGGGACPDTIVLDAISVFGSSTIF